MIEIKDALIENILNEIKEKRDAMTGIIPLDKASTIGEIASYFGLFEENKIYKEILRDEASSILTERLHKDMAYSSVLIPFDVASNITFRLMRLINTIDSRFYTNRRFNSPSWSPATGFVFDNGLLILDNQKAICVWFTDDD